MGWSMEALRPPRLPRHKVPGFSSFRLPGFLPLFVKVPLFEVSGIQLG